MPIVYDGTGMPRTRRPRAGKGRVPTPAPAPAPDPAVDESAGGAPPSVSSMTVDEVLSAVDAGDLDASVALAAELDGKARTTLTAALEARLE